MDKFDYILQTMDDLVGKHIKRLEGPFWRVLHESMRSPKNQCREILISFQQSIKTYIGLDYGRVLDASTGQCLQLFHQIPSDLSRYLYLDSRYQLLLDFFDELKLELEDFANHDLLIGKTDNTYCKEFGKKIAVYNTRLAFCFKGKKISEGTDDRLKQAVSYFYRGDMPQPPPQASSVKPKQPERPKPDAFQERILRGDFYMD
ncbi:hypothetical protein ACHAQJ_002427 [Trichoderma viride]